tara:strand:- start:2927 stop:3916 length:990 start_codon:yes stop_codon:yes gene_type:complete
VKESTIILSRTPFRISLGGGSTDLPSYYEKYNGFIFSAAISMYMDILFKIPRSDNFVQLHYKEFESVSDIKELKHELAREALKMHKLNKKISISFKSDIPAGTGLGSSGACAVSLHKGLATLKQERMNNLMAAEKSFELTQNLGLPDGVQDPYVCALGGFIVLNIDTKGNVNVTKPKISSITRKKFFNNCLFYFTGIKRDSGFFLTSQAHQKVLELKHKTKEIGEEIYQAFLNDDLDTFGNLLDLHWQVKKKMSNRMSSDKLDMLYDTARQAGASGGKIMGAGGGGFLMFYCPTEDIKISVQQALERYNMYEMFFKLSDDGARTKIIDL